MFNLRGKVLFLFFLAIAIINGAVIRDFPLNDLPPGLRRLDTNDFSIKISKQLVPITAPYIEVELINVNPDKNFNKKFVTGITLAVSKNFAIDLNAATEFGFIENNKFVIAPRMTKEKIDRFFLNNKDPAKVYIEFTIDQERYSFEDVTLLLTNKQKKESQFSIEGINENKNSAYSSVNFIPNSGDYTGYRYQISKLDGESYITTIESELKKGGEIKLNAYIKNIIKIFIFKEGKIVYETNALRVYSNDMLSYSFARKAFSVDSREQSITLTIASSLSDTKIFDLIEDVRLISDESQSKEIELTSEGIESGQIKKKKYSKKLVINQSNVSTYNVIRIKFIEKYIEIRKNELKVSIVNNWEEIVKFSSLDNCQYIRNNLNLDIIQKISNVDVYATLSAKGKKDVQFTNRGDRSLFVIFDDDSSLNTGNFEVKIYVDYDNFLLHSFEVSLTSMTPDKSISSPSVFNSIHFTGLTCKADNLVYKLENQSKKIQYILSCQSNKVEGKNEFEMTCRWTSYYVGGKYILTISGKKAFDVTLYTRSSTTASVILPQNTKPDLYQITITNVQYISKVTEVRIKKEEDSLPLIYYNPNKKENNSQLTFLFDDENNPTTIYITIDLSNRHNIVFTIDYLIFENYSIAYLRGPLIPYQFGYFFDIKERHFLYDPEKNHSIEINFDIEHKLDVFNKYIYYKYGNTLMAASCEKKEDRKLVCAFPGVTRVPSTIEVGIGEGLISKQTFYVLGSEIISENNCKVETIDSKDLSFKITSTYSTYIRASMNNSTGTYGVGPNTVYIDENGYYNYIFTISTQSLSLGNHTAFISFEDFQMDKIKVPYTEFEVVQKISILGTSEKNIYMLNEKQDFKVKIYPDAFSYEILGFGIKKEDSSNDFIIPIRRKEFTFTYTDVEVEDNLSVYLNDYFKTGKYRLYYLSSCGTYVESNVYVNVFLNKMKSITPWYNKINDLSKTYQVEFFYPITTKTPIFIVFELNDQKKYFDASGIGESNKLIFQLKQEKHLEEEGVYSIASGYLIMNDPYEEKSDLTFYAYYNEIELAEPGIVYLVNTLLSEFSIPLVNPIIKEQIYDIHFVNGKEKTLISEFNLSKDRDAIIFRFSYLLEDVKMYHIEIRESKTEDERKVHDFYVDSVSRSLTIDSINIKFPPFATTNTNEIVIAPAKKGEYDVTKIRYVKFKKINSITEKEEKEIYFCNTKIDQNYCEKNVIVDVKEGEFTLQIKYSVEDKFKYRYVLVRIEQTDDKFIEFTKNEYVLRDYEQFEDLFYANENGIDSIQTSFDMKAPDQISSSFAKQTYCKMTDETKKCETKCTQYGSTSIMNCTFTFENVASEGKDILIRFTSEDKNDKILHVISSGLEIQERKCQIFKFMNNIEFNIYSETSIGDFYLYVNDNLEARGLTDSFDKDSGKVKITLDEELFSTPENTLKNFSSSIRGGLYNQTIDLEDVKFELIDLHAVSHNGTLTMQLESDQKVEFLFNRELDEDDIKSLSIKHKDDSDSIEFTKCEINSKNKRYYKCYINLKDVEHTGKFSLYMTTKFCEKIFNLAYDVEVFPPPRFLTNITPTVFRMTGTGEGDNKLSLTYKYKLISEQRPKEVILIDYETGDKISGKATGTTGSSETIDFKLDFSERKIGYFSVTVVYDQDIVEAFSSTKILVYENEIEFVTNNETKWSGDKLDEIKINFKNRIVFQQIKNFTYKYTINNKTNEFELNESHYTFYGDFISLDKGDFTLEEGTYIFTIIDLDGLDDQYSVFVKKKVAFEDADFEFDYPRPGKEEEKNEITIKSSNYNLFDINYIVFTSTKSNEHKIVYLNSMTGDYEENILEFDIFLEKDEKLTLTEIVNNKGISRKSFTQQLILFGYSIEQDFFFIQKNKISVILNFYDDIAAENANEYLYFDNKKISNCKKQFTSLNCTYNIEENSPKTITVKVREEAKLIRKIYLLSYSLNNQCQYISNKLERITLFIYFPEKPENGFYTAYANDGKKNYNLLSSHQNDTEYIFQFSFSNLEKYTKFSYYLSKGSLQKLVEIPEAFSIVTRKPKIESILSTSEKILFQETFEVEVNFVRNLIEEEIVCLVLKRYGTTEFPVEYNSTLCKPTNGNKGEEFFRCYFDSVPQGKYLVSYIDPCGGEGEFSEDIYVDLVKSNNLLLDVTPKGRKLDNEEVIFTAKYAKEFYGPAKISGIELMTNENTVSSNEPVYNRSKITEGTKFVSFTVKSPNKEEGFFTIKSTFVNNVKEFSSKGILLYANEIELVKDSETHKPNTKIEFLYIELVYKIFESQIEKITYKDQRDKEIKVEYTLENDGKVIKVILNNFIVRGDYKFLIYDASRFGDFTVDYYVYYDKSSSIYFDVISDLLFINSTNKDVEILIDVGTNDLTKETIDNFVIVKGDCSSGCDNSEYKPLNCAYKENTNILSCSIEVDLVEYDNWKYIVAYKKEDILAERKTAYVTNYEYHPYESDSSRFFIHFKTSAPSLIFYIEDCEVTLEKSSCIGETAPGLSIYYVTYEKVNEAITKCGLGDGLHSLYGKHEHEKLPIREEGIDILTDKVLDTFNPDYLVPDEPATVSIILEGKVQDDEIIYFLFQNEKGSFKTTSCSLYVLNNSQFTCQVLPNDVKVGEYELWYMNRLGRIVSLNKSVTLKYDFKISEISPKYLDISIGGTIEIKYNKNMKIHKVRGFYIGEQQAGDVNYIPTEVRDDYYLVGTLLPDQIQIKGIYESFNIATNFNNEEKNFISGEQITLINGKEIKFEFNRLSFKHGETSTIKIRTDSALVETVFLYRKNGEELTKNSSKNEFSLEFVPNKSYEYVFKFKILEIDHIFTINKEIYVYDFITDILILEEPKACNFYKIAPSIKVNSYFPEILPKISVFISNKKEPLINDGNNNYFIKDFSEEDFKGQTVRILIKEVDAFDSETYYELYYDNSITFTDLELPKIIDREDTTIELNNVLCDLEITSLSFNSNSFFISSSDYKGNTLTLKLEYPLSFTSYGEATIGFEGKTIGTLIYSNTLKDSAFKISFDEKTLRNTPIKVESNEYYRLEEISNFKVKRVSTAQLFHYTKNNFDFNKSDNSITFIIDLFNYEYILSIQDHKSERDLSFKGPNYIAQYEIVKRFIFIDEANFNPQNSFEVRLKNNGDITKITIGGITPSCNKLTNGNYECKYITVFPGKVEFLYDLNPFSSESGYVSTYSLSDSACQVTEEKNFNPLDLIIISPTEAVYEVHFNNGIVNPINSYGYSTVTKKYELRPTETGRNNVVITSGNDSSIVINNIQIQSFISIKISSVTDVMYSHIKDQKLIINLSNTIREEDKPRYFRLSKESIEVSASKCELESNKKIITCTFDLSNIEPGKYSLSYEDPCNKSNTYSKKIDIQSPNKLKDVTKTIVQVGTTERITFYYSNNNSQKYIRLETTEGHQNICNIVSRSDVFDHKIYTVTADCQIDAVGTLYVISIYNGYTIKEEEITIYSMVSVGASPTLLSESTALPKDLKVEWIPVQFNEKITKQMFVKCTYQKNTQTLRVLEQNSNSNSDVKLPISVDEKRGIISVNVTSVGKLENSNLAFELYNGKTLNYEVKMLESPVEINTHLIIGNSNQVDDSQITTETNEKIDVYLKKGSNYYPTENGNMFKFTKYGYGIYNLAYTKGSSKVKEDIKSPIYFYDDISSIINLPLYAVNGKYHFSIKNGIILPGNFSHIYEKDTLTITYEEKDKEQKYEVKLENLIITVEQQNKSSMVNVEFSGNAAINKNKFTVNDKIVSCLGEGGKCNMFVEDHLYDSTDGAQLKYDGIFIKDLKKQSSGDSKDNIISSYTSEKIKNGDNIMFFKISDSSPYTVENITEIYLETDKTTIFKKDAKSFEEIIKVDNKTAKIKFYITEKSTKISITTIKIGKEEISNIFTQYINPSSNPVTIDNKILSVDSNFTVNFSKYSNVKVEIQGEEFELEMVDSTTNTKTYKLKPLIPLTINEKKVEIKVVLDNKEEVYFEVTFIQNYYPKLRDTSVTKLSDNSVLLTFENDISRFSLKESATIRSQDLININCRPILQNNTNILLDCKEPLPENIENLAIKLEVGEYPINFNISKICIDQVSNGTGCKDCGGTEFFSKGLCLQECPSFHQKRKCVDECPVFFEDNKCVTQCSVGHGRLSEDSFSKNCTKCEGTKYSFGGICVEEDNIPKDFICKEDKTTGNYCTLEIPKSCENGKLIEGKFCSCNPGFKGIKCMVKNEDEDEDEATSIFKEIFEIDISAPIVDGEFEKGTLNFNDAYMANSLNKIIESSSKNIDVLKDLSVATKQSFISSTIQTMKDLDSVKEVKSMAINMIGLSFTIADQSTSKMRRLEETPTIPKEEVDDQLSLIEEAHKINEKLAEQGNYGEDEDKFGNFKYYRYSEGNNVNFKSALGDDIIINFNDCFLNNPGNTIVVGTEVPGNYKNFVENNVYNLNGKAFIISVSDGEETIDFSKCEKITIKAGINTKLSEEALKALEKGINPFDPEDPAFTEPCYINNNYTYDLPQRYRKQIYQNRTLTPKGIDFCEYNGFEGSTYTAKYTCKPDQKFVLPGTSDDSINRTLLKNYDKVENLPIKCGSHIKDVSKNNGFWVFLWILVIFAITNGFVALIEYKHWFGNTPAIQKTHDFERVADTQEDIFTPKDEKQMKTVATTQGNPVTTRGPEQVVEPENVTIQMKNGQNESNDSSEEEGLGSIILKNFKQLHPVLSLCYHSIILPMTFNEWIFVFNVLGMLGFNAIYFTESMVEKRVEQNDRNSFAYPLKHEASRIFGAIFTQVLFTLLVRGMSIVTYEQFEDLKRRTHKLGGEELIMEMNKFSREHLVQKILVGALTLILEGFYFFYCMSFCSVYRKSQNGWLFSGIWSLFFVWIIFAPIFIVLYSVIQKFVKNKKVSYYLKRLFLF